MRSRRVRKKLKQGTETKVQPNAGWTHLPSSLHPFIPLFCCNLTRSSDALLAHPTTPPRERPRSRSRRGSRDAEERGTRGVADAQDSGTAAAEAAALAASTSAAASAGAAAGALLAQLEQQVERSMKCTRCETHFCARSVPFRRLWCIICAYVYFTHLLTRLRYVNHHAGRRGSRESCPGCHHPAR